MTTNLTTKETNTSIFSKL